MAPPSTAPAIGPSIIAPTATGTVIIDAYCPGSGIMAIPVMFITNKIASSSASSIRYVSFPFSLTIFNSSCCRSAERMQRIFGNLPFINIPHLPLSRKRFLKNRFIFFPPPPLPKQKMNFFQKSVDKRHFIWYYNKVADRCRRDELNMGV